MTKKEFETLVVKMQKHFNHNLGIRNTQIITSKLDVFCFLTGLKSQNV